MFVRISKLLQQQYANLEKVIPSVDELLQSGQFGVSHEQFLNQWFQHSHQLDKGSTLDDRCNGLLGCWQVFSGFPLGCHRFGAGSDHCRVLLTRQGTSGD